MAQLVEQLIRNQQVTGSSPVSSSREAISHAYQYVKPFASSLAGRLLHTDIYGACRGLAVRSTDNSAWLIA